MGRRRAAHAAEADNNQVETVHKMPRERGQATLPRRSEAAEAPWRSFADVGF
jgi:hypothetical protein